MIDLNALLAEERNLGKNPAASYKKEAFQDIDSKLEKLPDDAKAELRTEALEMIDDYPDSIVLPYVSGRLLLFLRPHEYNMRLNNILLSFYEARNWDVVEYIGNIILSVSESPKALRVLGDVADQKGEEEKKWDYYERLVRTDSQNHDIIVIVADHFDELGDKKAAMNCYQRALQRLRKSEEYPELRRIFTKLLENGRSEFPFYSSFLEGLSEESPETALALYKELFVSLKKNRADYDRESSEYRRNTENMIEVLRRIVSADRESVSVREDLVAILREKYASSPRLEKCLARYDILHASDPQKALEDFEKDISYAKGTYVIQNALSRVGLITEVTDSKVTVRYSVNDEQTMDLQHAFTGLTPLTKQHLKAIKKGVPADKIKAKIMGEGGIEWLVRTLLYSAPEHQASLKDMKADVVPSILSESEWKSISEKVKDELKRNRYVLILSSGRSDLYKLTAYPVTAEDKTLYAFRSKHDISDKIGVLEEAVEDEERIDLTSDPVLDMISYFEEMLDNEARPLFSRVASALFLDWLSEEGVAVSFNTSFESLIQNLSDYEIKDVFAPLPNFLKKEFVNHITEGKRAAELLILVFPYFISSYIPNKLKKISKGSVFCSYVRKCFDSYRDNIPAFVFFSTQYPFSPSDLKKLDLSDDKIIRTKLIALSTLRDDVNKDAIKYKNSLKKDLLDDGNLARYIGSAERAAVEELIPLILSNTGFESSDKDAAKAMISSRFPDISFEAPEKAEPVKTAEIKVVTGFLCTEESYNRKQAELKDINIVQMPEILKEINFARELGDLRENSEYQYAKEHKRELERRIAELGNDLSTVRIMQREDVIDGLIGFGTRVKLYDNIENHETSYTFFGRWESDPENGIIDINAPLGRMLVNHKEGDKVRFSINDREFDLSVISIEKIPF